MTVGLLAQQMSEALGPIAKSVGSEEAEGGCPEERETFDTKRSLREKAGCSERKISPRRVRRTQREIRLKKNFVIFVYFVVENTTPCHCS